MNLTYTFSPQIKRKRLSTYRLEDLRRMTLMQLIDVCESEGIINVAIDRMDREELIHLIMKFRGNREVLLIQHYDEEGFVRLEKEIQRVKKIELEHKIHLPSKISLFEGLDTNYFDGYKLPYLSELEGVNALVVDRGYCIRAMLQVVPVPGKEDLYLVRKSEIPCSEAPVHDYRVILFPQKLSDAITSVYAGTQASLPNEIQVYCIPLLQYAVCVPKEAGMPLAVDFGTSNTTAGVYVNNAFYSRIQDNILPERILPEAINYVQFLNNAGDENPLLPTVIGVDSISGDSIEYNVGFDAEVSAGHGYINEGFCVFYDIKRWVASFDEEVTLTDSIGNYKIVQRKDVIRAFLLHIIHSAEQRFKCRFKSIFLSYPVKQRERFLTLYQGIFPEYDILKDEVFDEGIAVLYDIIGGLIDQKKYSENQTYKALILDCGGGTTDQSSASFSISKGRVGFDIKIETAYENGDTDFGGNNLTYRIMQLLKVAAAHHVSANSKSVDQILRNFPSDIFRTVDEHGCTIVYAELDEAYVVAESVIPTRYKEYEYGSREEYFMVCNNFHYLFSLAEQVKKAFFGGDNTLKITISSNPLQSHDLDTVHVQAARWKLSVRSAGNLKIIKEFPSVTLNTQQVRQVFKADIYNIIKRFIGKLYDEGTLPEYQIVKLTGQSCKIDLFRECLKEYVPGVLITQGNAFRSDRFRLKLACLEGSIRYLRDKNLGLAKVDISSRMPALPYILAAYRHDGEKVILVHPLDRERVSGSVSRHMASNEVELHLSDAHGAEKFIYSISCDPDSFRQVTYEDIQSGYGDHIPQSEVDIIENGEVRYFVWADAGQWGFSIVPISRRNEELHIGEQQLRSFENESWMTNYFDGKH